MKLTTSSPVRWAITLFCAAGTFLLTPASYARRPHAKIELSREDRSKDKGTKDSRHEKDKDSSNDSSPDKSDS
jgi:hypothetical protein